MGNEQVYVNGYSTINLNDHLAFDTGKITNPSYINNHINYNLYKDDELLNQTDIDNLLITFDNKTGIITFHAKTAYHIDKLSIKAHDDLYDLNSQATNQFNISVVNHTSIKIENISDRQFIKNFEADHISGYSFTSENLIKYIKYDNGIFINETDALNITFVIIQNDKDITNKY